jgi:hypothetical protein
MAHFMCCLWNSLENVKGRECVEVGFAVGVCEYCVVASRVSEMVGIV